MYMSVNDMSVGRSRLERVFRYMKALNDERNPVVRRVDEHSLQWVLWLHDLPVHPCVTLAAPVGEDAGRDGGGLGDLSESDCIVLRVRRPQLREAPRIPESLVGWIKPVWEQPDGSAEVYGSLEHVGEDQSIQSVAFAASARRVTDFAAWSECWQEWSAKERVAREVSRVFEKLYALYGIIQREAQRVELILGDGILSWRLDDGGIHHPLILIRVQLDFNADVPEFTIRETGLDPELYTALFGASADVDARAMAACRRDFDTGEFHPLAGPNTDAFLARMVVALSPRGEFIGRGTPAGERDEPGIGRDPVIFLRRRTSGFARAIEATIEDIRVTDQLPAALMRIVGVDCGQNREDEQHSDESLEQPSEDGRLGSARGRAVGQAGKRRADPHSENSRIACWSACAGSTGHRQDPHHCQSDRPPACTGKERLGHKSYSQIASGPAGENRQRASTALRERAGEPRGQ